MLVGYVHPVTFTLSVHRVTKKSFCVLFFFLITGGWSDSLSNLFRIMKASPSEAILIPLASNPAASTARHRHSKTQLAWFISCVRSDCMVLLKVPVFTMQEGGVDYIPSCCQDGTLVSFSLMTNPAGLSLIISTHKQHTHTHTRSDTHVRTHQDGLKVPQASVGKGIEGKDDRELC